MVKVDVAPIAVTGQPFTDAVRATVKEGSGHEWAVQLVASTTAPVDTGDAILATFFLRTEAPQEGGVGETEFVFELNGSPYTKSVQYPVQGATDWSKIEVRFKASRAYAAGEAHAIFRLGYDRQTIEIGGVKVESFGKQIPFSSLPATQGADRKREHEAAAAAKAKAAAEAALPPNEGGELRVDVSTSEVIRPISPYVYGVNSQPTDGVGATARRMGGNRQTAYNWELNASNAGSDYNHSSDKLALHGARLQRLRDAGRAVHRLRAGEPQGGHRGTVATVPMIDYVTADTRGPVPESEKAPSKRWNKSVAQKPGPFVTSPDLGDGVVYEDEFVNALVGKLGKAAAGGIKFYSLDNEPALWPSTHPRVHPEKTTYAEMVSRTEATAGGLLKGRSDRLRAGRGGVRLERVPVAAGRARRRRAQRHLRHLPRLLPGLDEEAGGQAQEAAHPRARRPLVSGGARREADHRPGPDTEGRSRRASRRRAACGIRATWKRAGSRQLSAASRSASSPGCRRRSPPATPEPS